MVLIRVTNAVIVLLIGIWWVRNRHSDLAEPVVFITAAIVVLEELVAELVVPRFIKKRAARTAKAQDILSGVKARIDKEESHIAQVIEGRRKGDKVVEESPLDLLEPEIQRLAAVRRYGSLARLVLLEIERNRTLEAGHKEFGPLRDLLAQIKSKIGDGPPRSGILVRFAIALCFLCAAAFAAFGHQLPKDKTDDQPTVQKQENESTAHRSNEPSAAASIDDLSTDAAAILHQAPGIAKVKRHGPDGQPTHRIVHVADWHFVDRESYAADLRSLSDESLSDEEIDRRFAELLDEVEQVQDQQMAVLRWLIKHHGLKRIHIEGLTEQDKFIFDAKISALRKVGQQLADLRKQKDELLADGERDAEATKIIDGINAVEQQYRRDLLQIGAAGKLLLSSEIEAVLPLEDEKAYQAANPVAEDGTVTLDLKKIEARQDGQVRLLLDGGPFAVITLGGAHDLSDNLERLSDGKAEYIRVEVEEWKKVAGEVE